VGVRARIRNQFQVSGTELRRSSASLLAKKVLNGEHGGPSLSFQDGEFIVYQWYDAPVQTQIIGKGQDIREALEDAIKRNGEPYPC
jgi:hypothetical protein